MIRTLIGLMLCGVAMLSAAPRPNIIFVITDDQGYGDFSIHGNPHLQTPHIDNLARTGVRFDRFFDLGVVDELGGVGMIRRAESMWESERSAVVGVRTGVGMGEGAGGDDAERGPVSDAG